MHGQGTNYTMQNDTLQKGRKPIHIWNCNLGQLNI